jgi:Tfp pilus assembly protein PilF
MFRRAALQAALVWWAIGEVAHAGAFCHSHLPFPVCRNFAFGYTHGGYGYSFGLSHGCYNYWGPPLGGYVYGGPIVYPPLFIDGGDLFGPRAVLRFFDLGARPAPPIAVAIAEARLAAPPPADDPQPLAPIAAAPQPAESNNALAWRFVEYGDKHFRNGKYHQALQRYKKATATAADHAQAYFRQGLAHLALGKYERATQAFQRGLQLKPDWPQSGFLLDELYQNDRPKAEHRRALLLWLDEHPLDADAHFMLGVHRFLNGEHEQAEAAFRRTLELSGIGEHAKAFLNDG